MSTIFCTPCAPHTSCSLAFPPLKKVHGELTHMQGWTLLALGPFLDKYVSGLWVNHYEWSTPAIAVLSLSCACAIFVNLSQFACLGRFSAVSFQVCAALGSTIPSHVIPQSHCPP